MTKQQKALEAVQGIIEALQPITLGQKRRAIVNGHIETIRSALTPQPQIDVEELEKAVDILYGLNREGQLSKTNIRLFLKLLTGDENYGSKATDL